jgi:short-subunit dehydrogenase
MNWDRHVVVTGASSGIGEALARELARAGARLTLVARRRERLEKLAGEIGGRSVALAHDLSDPAGYTDWIPAAEAALGPIDMIVNNAGVENTGPAAQASIEEGVRLLQLNLHAPLVIVRTLLPAMLARNSGHIVNIASIAALAPVWLQAWYSGSKSGLAAYSEALRGELRHSGVRVLTVYPGPVTTPGSEQSYAKFGGRKGVVAIVPEGKPDVLARRIRAAIEAGRARLIYPRVYSTARWFPWLARWIVDGVAPRPANGK